MRTYELLHRIAGEGLSVEYCFSRQPFPGGPHMVAVQIQISNNTDAEVKSLRVSEPKPLSGMRIQEFPEIGMAWRGGGGRRGGEGQGQGQGQGLAGGGDMGRSGSPMLSECLAPGDTASVVMGIDFCDSTQAANFQLR